MSKPIEALRTLAQRYPEAQEGVACKGTPLEKSTFTARKKAFLFLGLADAMLKLRDSLEEATRLAAKEPSRYKVGAHGWVTATFSDGKAPPPGVLERWVDESYRLIANKQLVAMLPRGDLLAATKKPARKKLVRKKFAGKKPVSR